MEWLIGTNITTFIITWLVSRILTRKQMLEEQAQMEIIRKNTEMWKEIFEKIQGGRDE